MLQVAATNSLYALECAVLSLLEFLHQLSSWTFLFHLNLLLRNTSVPVSSLFLWDALSYKYPHIHTYTETHNLGSIRSSSLLFLHYTLWLDTETPDSDKPESKSWIQHLKTGWCAKTNLSPESLVSWTTE